MRFIMVTQDGAVAANKDETVTRLPEPRNALLNTEFIREVYVHPTTDDTVIYLDGQGNFAGRKITVAQSIFDVERKVAE